MLDFVHILHERPVSPHVRIRTQTGASHRQFGKSVIRGEKLTKTKKYSLIGK
jgi:hypothetical protein